jgi:hypothetical protein
LGETRTRTALGHTPCCIPGHGERGPEPPELFRLSQSRRGN